MTFTQAMGQSWKAKEKAYVNAVFAKLREGKSRKRIWDIPMQSKSPTAARTKKFYYLLTFLQVCKLQSASDKGKENCCLLCAIMNTTYLQITNFMLPVPTQPFHPPPNNKKQNTTTPPN